MVPSHGMGLPVARVLVAFVVMHALLAGAQQCSFAENTDYVGGNLRWTEPVGIQCLTREECCKLCDEEPHCTAAVFMGAACYLKDASRATRKSGMMNRIAVLPTSAQKTHMREAAIALRKKKQQNIGASCAVYGCGGYRAGHECQCNKECVENGDCCSDYKTDCAPLDGPLPPLAAGGKENEESDVSAAASSTHIYEKKVLSQASYEKLDKGSDGCSPGLEITSPAQCRAALLMLGLRFSLQVSGQSTDTPRFCSVAESPEIVLHWNTASLGHKRSDLAPVCYKASVPAALSHATPKRLQPARFTASDSSDDQIAQKAFDGDVNTKWHSDGPRAWFTAALPHGQKETLTRLEFHMSEEAWSARWPGSIFVYGSNDLHKDIAWTRLWSSSLKWDGKSAKTENPYTPASSQAYHAFKFEVANRYPKGTFPMGQDAEANKLSVHELVLFGTHAYAREASKQHEGSCGKYGCVSFTKNHSCQCNALCIRYGNCCSDYATKCSSSGGGGSHQGPAPTQRHHSHSASHTGSQTNRSQARAGPSPGEDGPLPTMARTEEGTLLDSPTPPGTCKLEQDIDYMDGFQKEIGAVESPQECANLCLSMKGCTHFTIAMSLWYKICYVKSGTPANRKMRKGTVAGVCNTSSPETTTTLSPRPMAGKDEGDHKNQAREHRAATAEMAIVPIDMFRAMQVSAAKDEETMDDDVADLGGDLKYVHTELITEHLLDPLRLSRKYNIDCIRRQRYKIHNPTSMANVTDFVDFGPFITFDFGMATNPAQAAVLRKYGDFIGIQPECYNGGCDPRFPSEIPYYWFSVGNFCPNLPWGQKGSTSAPAAGCLQYEENDGYLTGGLCPGGWDRHHAIPTVEPTGDRGCSYSYAKSDVVMLDELAGITTEDCGGRYCADWADFRMNCGNKNYRRKFDGDTGKIIEVPFCVEYDIIPACEADCHSPVCMQLRNEGQEVELGLPFWRGRCDPRGNQLRFEMLAGAFGIQGAYTEHNLIDKELGSLHIPCVREGSFFCRPVEGDEIRQGPYCTRRFSGVCQPCWIPGTDGRSSPEQKPYCPMDIFRMVDYKNRESFPFPKCQSRKASDLCCLYAGTCEGSSDPEEASLDADGLALVASRQSTADMATFLSRAAPRGLKLSDVWDQDGLHGAAYYQWSVIPNNKSLEQAIIEVGQFLGVTAGAMNVESRETSRNSDDNSVMVIRKFLSAGGREEAGGSLAIPPPPGLLSDRGLGVAWAALAGAALLAAAACWAMIPASRGRTLYMMVGSV